MSSPKCLPPVHLRWLPKIARRLGAAFAFPPASKAVRLALAMGEVVQRVVRLFLRAGAEKPPSAALAAVLSLNLHPPC